MGRGSRVRGFQWLMALVALALGAGGLGLLARSIASGNVSAPRRPFPQHIAYAPGTIRPNHRTQAEQDDDVRAAYDDWKRQYLVEAGATGDGDVIYRVAFGKPGTPNHASTVSEGQGYGMLIAALMAGHEPAAQAIFNGLWRFSRAHPSAQEPRLMTWRVPGDGGGSSSAFDGDADMAYALLLADQQWGSAGAVDYAADARALIDAIAEVTIGPNSRLPLLGDWVSPYGVLHNEYTPRSSDFIAGHFRAFGRATGDPVWPAVVTASQATITALQTRHSPDTGLLPDFIEPVSATDHSPRPADAGFLEGDRDGMYAYNAGRDPWRIAADALHNDDATSLAQARKISAWAAAATGGDPRTIKPGYQLDGAPIPPANYFTTFFAAPLGVAAMTMPAQQTWLNDIYDAVYNTRENYYEDSVTLLCLLVMTGNAWDPTTPAAPANISLPLVYQR